MVIPPYIFRWQMVDESMLKLFANYLHNPLQPQYLLTFLQLQLRALISSIFRFVIPPQLVGCQVLNACCNYFCGISTLSTTATKILSVSPIFQVLRIPPSKTIGCQNCVVDASCNHLWTIYRIAIICHASLRFWTLKVKT